MSNPKDEHHKAVVFDFTNDWVRAHSVSPEFPEAGAARRRSDAARIAQRGDSFMKEFQNPPGVLRVEFFQFPVGLGRQFNLPDHDAS